MQEVCQRPVEAPLGALVLHEPGHGIRRLLRLVGLLLVHLALGLPDGSNKSNRVFVERLLLYHGADTDKDFILRYGRNVGTRGWLNNPRQGRIARGSQRIVQIGIGDIGLECCQIDVHVRAEFLGTLLGIGRHDAVLLHPALLKDSTQRLAVHKLCTLPCHGPVETTQNFSSKRVHCLFRQLLDGDFLHPAYCRFLCLLVAHGNS